MEHSKLPFYYENANGDIEKLGPNEISEWWHIYDSDRYFLFIVHSKEFAAFTVKACNMHGKLIAMLKRLIMEANQSGITNETFDDAESMLDEAEAE